MVSIILLIEDDDGAHCRVSHHENFWEIHGLVSEVATEIISCLELFHSNVKFVGFDWSQSLAGDNVRALALTADGFPGSEDENDVKQELYDLLSSLTVS